MDYSVEFNRLNQKTRATSLTLPTLNYDFVCSFAVMLKLQVLWYASLSRISCQVRIPRISFSSEISMTTGPSSHSFAMVERSYKNHIQPALAKPETPMLFGKISAWLHVKYSCTSSVSAQYSCQRINVALLSIDVVANFHNVLFSWIWWVVILNYRTSCELFLFGKRVLLKIMYFSDITDGRIIVRLRAVFHVIQGWLHSKKGSYWNKQHILPHSGLSRNHQVETLTLFERYQRKRAEGKKGPTSHKRGTIFGGKTVPEGLHPNFYKV